MHALCTLMHALSERQAEGCTLSCTLMHAVFERQAQGWRISPRLIHADARAFRERSTLFYTYTHTHGHGHGQTPQIQTLTAAGGLASGGQDSFFFPFPPFPFAPPSVISATPTPPKPPPRCFGETCKASARKACTPCPPTPCPMFSTCASTAVFCTSGCWVCSSPPASSLSHLSACDIPANTHPRPHTTHAPNGRWARANSLTFTLTKFPLTLGIYIPSFPIKLCMIVSRG